MKILLVEDDKLFQNCVSSFAKSSGVELHVVNDGKEAVSLCAEGNTYDIILMDNYMLELNGIAATQKIRGLSNGSNYVILLISADEMSEDDLKLNGFNGFIKKPMNKSNFEDLINKY